MIHVAYRLWGGDGFFAKMLAVSMLSMFENTKEKVTVHVMHNDRLTPDNRGKFCYIAGQYNQQIEFHNVEEIAGETLRILEAALPAKDGINAAYYPLIIHKVFPNLDKIIFFGTDTVINLDIGELWAYDLNGEIGIGAVPEIYSSTPKNSTVPIILGIVKHEDYFNADVMLMSPAFIRDNFKDILNAIKQVNNNHFYCYEQDALNILYAQKILKLPKKFNRLADWLRNSEIFESGKGIYQFKPHFDSNDVYNQLYFKYFLKTPYANADMFWNIGKVCKKIFNRICTSSKDNLLQFTNLIAKRKRGFFVDSNNIVAVQQIFEIKDDELIISTSESDSVENLINAMNESKGNKIFFILFDNYFALRNALIQRGFIENQDFVNGIKFLSEKYGVKIDFNSREIVQSI